MNYCMFPDVVCRFIEYRRTTVVVLGLITGCCTAVLGDAVLGDAVVANAVEVDALFRVPADVQAVFRDNCIDCHNEDVSEGNVDLSGISELGSSERLELLNKAQEQLHFGFMPPEESVPLSSVDQGKVLNWVGAELREHGASRLEDKLRMPGYGNYLDHDELFSGRHEHLQPFTYDRLWLISEYIFEARFNEILNHRPFKTIDGKRQYVIGDNNRRVNLTNPFLLPTNTGVRYYAKAT